MHQKNYFLNTERASYYDRTRPSFHKEAMVSYHQSNPFKIYDLVLDFGCGAGRCRLFFQLSNVEAALERGEDKMTIENDIKKLVETQSTGEPYRFQVRLTEILKK